MIGAEQRPGGEYFAEGSASDQAFTVGNPIDFEGNIRAIVQQEQANRSEDFNPAWWLRGEIGVMFAQQLDQSQPEVKKEQQLFFYALRAAWDLVAYEQIDGEHNDSAYHDINGYTHVFRSETIRLSPLGVTLLDAMAEALDIPHNLGQAEFDISLFSDEALWEKIENEEESTNPTAEEVKKAIKPQQEQ